MAPTRYQHLHVNSEKWKLSRKREVPDKRIHSPRGERKIAENIPKKNVQRTRTKEFAVGSEVRTNIATKRVWEGSEMSGDSVISFRSNNNVVLP